MRATKIIFVHIPTAIITGLIALAVITHGPRIAASAMIRLQNNDEAALLLLFLSAAALYFLIAFIHSAISYLYFLFGTKRKMCGLYIEAYFNPDDMPRLSLMLIYFNLRTEELEIAGYSYCRDTADKLKLAPFASWESRAVFHSLSKNDFELFYVHEGDVEARSKVLGTTVCKLPLSDRLTRYGYFCDLKDITDEPPKPQTFDVIRARQQHAKEFIDGLTHPVIRAKSILKLGAPREQDFLAFARRKGYTLIEKFADIPRSDKMREVHKALSIT